MSIVPQVAHMDETVVGVFGSPFKSQDRHFVLWRPVRSRNPGVEEMEQLMKPPEDFKKATIGKN